MSIGKYQGLLLLELACASTLSDVYASAETAASMSIRQRRRSSYLWQLSFGCAYTI